MRVPAIKRIDGSLDSLVSLNEETNRGSFWSRKLCGSREAARGVYLQGFSMVYSFLVDHRAG